MSDAGVTWLVRDALGLMATSYGTLVCPVERAAAGRAPVQPCGSMAECLACPPLKM